jgi:hypothetical protein
MMKRKYSIDLDNYLSCFLKSLQREKKILKQITPIANTILLNHISMKEKKII